jgi:hypothetical protein
MLRASMISSVLPRTVTSCSTWARVLVLIALHFRGGEGPSGRSKWSKPAIRFRGGPAVRIFFAPPASPVSPVPSMATGAKARGGEFRMPQSRSFYDCARFEGATGFQPDQTLRDIVVRFVQAERGQD